MLPVPARTLIAIGTTLALMLHIRCTFSLLFLHFHVFFFFFIVLCIIW